MAKNKRTPRQKKLLRNLSKGMPLGLAATDAGYSAKNASQSGHQALALMKKTMPEVMEKAGLTDEALIEKYLKPALEAHETEFAKFEGKISDERDVIAWGPRLTALDLACKLKGAYAPVKATADVNINEVKVSIVRIGIADRITAEAGAVL